MRRGSTACASFPGQASSSGVHARSQPAVQTRRIGNMFRCAAPPCSSNRVFYDGTKWAIFEPNDEALWARLRLSVGSFMDGLFNQGAFAGETPARAYFVQCGPETTTQSDIDRGVVHIVVGF